MRSSSTPSAATARSASAAPSPTRGGARRARHRAQPRRSERAGTRREPSRRSRPLLRGLPRLAAHPRVRGVHPRVGGGTDRRRADGLTAGTPLPRPRAREGAGDAPADAVAPGPAVLQRRRPPGLLAVDARRPGRPRVDGRVRRRLASRSVAHAEDVHGLGGEVVPGGKPRGPARHRGRIATPSRSSRGSSSRETASTSTC